MEIQPHRLVGPALEYAGLADLNFPGAALAYVGYRGARSAYNRYSSYRRNRAIDMAYGKRPSTSSTWIPGRGGRRAPIKRRRVGGIYRRRSFRNRGGMSDFNSKKSNNVSTHFQCIKDMPAYAWELDPTVATETAFQAFPYQLVNCPSFAFWRKMYKFYKLQWMKVEMHCTDRAVQGASSVNTDSVALVTSMASMLTSFNVRVHDFTETAKRTPQRTIFFKGVTGYEDFLETSDAETDLANVEANMRKIVLNTLFRSDAEAKLRPVISFGVIFKGLSHTAATQIGNSAAITARPT